jgi:hypothetical protein
MMSTLMKSAKLLFRTALIAGVFCRRRPRSLLAGLSSSAASQLSSQSGSQESGALSMSSLTSLLNGGSQSLTASSMNNAAGIMSYCAKQKLASVTNTENVKNQVLDKLGLSTPEKQKEDTSYLEGLQGLLSNNSGQQLNLNTLGSSPLAEKVKTKACDLVLKQGVNFLS